MWLRKPKTEEGKTASLCQQCGEREAVVRLTRHDPAGSTPQSVQLCAVCAPSCAATILGPRSSR